MTCLSYVLKLFWLPEWAILAGALKVDFSDKDYLIDYNVQGTTLV